MHAARTEYNYKWLYKTGEIESGGALLTRDADVVETVGRSISSHGGGWVLTCQF